MEVFREEKSVRSVCAGSKSVSDDFLFYGRNTEINNGQDYHKSTSCIILNINNRKYCI